jgi:predicted CXXCH cytochrome family protein
MTTKITRRLWLLCVAVACFLLFVAVCGAQVKPQTAKSSCVECHSSFPAPTGVTEEQWAADIHAQKGLTCASCHGGDPKDASPEGAMSKKAGFRGKPKRTEIPAMCAKCHSDGSYMRQYNPSLRTDQFAQYQTSVHGKRLTKGDTKVAVCIDCHSVHGIRPAKDPRSTVNPLNVANTCARCHSDAAYMKDYKIKTDQFAGYSASVHHDAMVVRGDLSAPTCSTCHGNHGAAPPGVASVEAICSTCHVFQAQLFDTSPHKAAFAAMGAGSCITCHSNHRIVHPTDKMIGTGNEAICTNCHATGDPGFAAAARIHEDLTKLDEALKRSDEVLDKAERSGMEVSQARLEEAQGRDSLIKARVTIHSFQSDKVEQDTQAGMKIAEKTYKAGLQALAERDYRRKGLGLSLITIVAVLIGLWMYIRQIESRKQSGGS